MDRVPGLNSLPRPPVFGVANSDTNGNNVGVNTNKFINIDEIFADCFMGGESDLLSMPANLANMGGNNTASHATAAATPTSSQSGAAGAAPGTTAVGVSDQVAGFTGTGGIIQPVMGAGIPGMPYLGQPLQQGSVGAGDSQTTQQQQKEQQQQQQQPQQRQRVGIPRARSAPTSGGMGGSILGGGDTAGGSVGKSRSALSAGLEEDDDEDEEKAKRGKRIRQGGRNMTEQQRLERRERNREHAKRSRVRKKFLLESLQKSVTALQEENEKLREAIHENLGADQAKELLANTDSSTLIASAPGEATRVLDDPDYSLVKALQTAQQNFVITDPTLPDNPIVFASQGFLDLTGYTLEQVLGRNCRFLQGPDTDPKAVEKIRKASLIARQNGTAIEQGLDASVCIRNYRVDGVMFWNQFFIAALRDSEGAVINYVGVQCRVNEDFVCAVQRQEQEGGGGQGGGGVGGEGDEGEEEEEEEGSEGEHQDADVL